MIDKKQIPEEVELRQKEELLRQKQEMLAERELDLLTLRAELHSFEVEYLIKVGAKYVHIDRLQATLDYILASKSPKDINENKRAAESNAKAQQSEKDAIQFIQLENAKYNKFEATPELQSSYRELIKRVHPVLTLDPHDEQRRHELMEQINDSYQAGDLKRLNDVMKSENINPENNKVDSFSAALIKTIRKIMQIEERLTAIECDLEQLHKTDLFVLFKAVGKKAAKGINQLGVMAAEVESRITFLQNQIGQASELDTKTEEDHLCGEIDKVGNNTIARYSNALIRRAFNDLSSESQIYDSAILMVDDDIAALDLLVMNLKAGGFKNIDTAVDGKDATEKLLSGKYKLISLNLNIPSVNGFEVLEFMNAHNIQTKAIIITEFHSEDAVSLTMDLGALAYIDKPITSEQLISTVTSVLKQIEASRMKSGLDPADNLFINATFKQADRLVLAGNYTAALEAIAKAHERYPKNMLVLAYEERIRSIFATQKDKKIETEGHLEYLQDISHFEQKLIHA